MKMQFILTLKNIRGDIVILPYYKIDKTEKDKYFFFTHKGYFNFWDEYLIVNIGTQDLFTVLVNRPNRKFNRVEKPNEKYRTTILMDVGYLNYLKKPKKMFVDFPELGELKLKFLDSSKLK